MMSDMSMYQTQNQDGKVPEWSFSDRLRKAREWAEMEQSDLAPLISKKRSTISGWERGHHMPDDLAIRAIAHYTGVSYHWLKYGREESADSAQPSTRWESNPHPARPGETVGPLSLCA